MPKPELVISMEERVRVQFKRAIWAKVEFTSRADRFAEKQRDLSALIDMALELGIEVPAEIERQARKAS